MDTYLTKTGTTSVAGRGVAAPVIDDLEDAASLFLQDRPSLLKIACRILGSVSEAEDVVQEVWLRLQRTDRTVVKSPSALLRTITVRMAINAGQSARRRREYSATPWLPETPDPESTPEAVADRQDAVERASVLMLETLTPRQRAAFVLREGFAYPYDQIAALLCISVVNARQQVARAQQRLGAGRRRQPVDSVTHRRFVQALLAAAQGGDLNRLERFLVVVVDDDDDGGRPGCPPT